MLVRIAMKPIIAMTMGDPCGIGPEVIVKALAMGTFDCRPVVVGCAAWMQQAAKRFAPSLVLRPIVSLADAVFDPRAVDLFDIPTSDDSSWSYGSPHPSAATAAQAALECAVRMAMNGEVDAIATAPIHKAAMQQIGFAFPGHTEFLAHRAGVESFGMMMVGGGLKITLATIHLSLRKAARVRKEQILTAIRLTHQSMQRDFGLSQPKIAVAALNPHAGEAGLFGDEEHLEVTPAVSAAQTEGIGASGPYPADTLFHRLKSGEFDAAVALYHDQALIPIKLLAFGNAVNVTLGLPFVRTSVDHGTAYDIAGHGIADPGSLRAALSLACDMARHRNATRRPLAS